MDRVWIAHWDLDDQSLEWRQRRFYLGNGLLNAIDKHMTLMADEYGEAEEDTLCFALTSPAGELIAITVSWYRVEVTGEKCLILRIEK